MECNIREDIKREDIKREDIKENIRLGVGQNARVIEFSSRVMEMMAQLEMDETSFQAMVVELVELELSRRQREDSRRRAWAAQHRITARRSDLKVI